MKLLFLEIWLYLLLAFLLGMFVQWFFCCRGKQTSTDEAAKNADHNSAESKRGTITPKTTVQAATAPTVSENARPMGLADIPEAKDELKRIKGIGAVIEDTLNGLGVYTFQQIAEWDEDNVAWVENHLAFPGRIGRENWVSQAKTLATGGETEFSKRVDDGEVNY